MKRKDTTTGSSKSKIRVISYIILGILILFIDQILRYYTDRGFFIRFGLFQISRTTNTGIAFGLFQGFNAAILWLYVSIFGLFLAFYEELIKRSRLGFTLVIIGLLSNFYDRLVYGFVRDYIVVWKWPVFNMADLIINIGVFLFFISLFKKHKTLKSS